MPWVAVTPPHVAVPELGSNLTLPPVLPLATVPAVEIAAMCFQMAPFPARPLVV